ncbi:hypothetical protein MSHI_05760 [Mycobacterium shinjukuense]|uniref:Uncharacterized protein n=1 Tax=Mycobacterium shinjukuense TaxID=398694 RepID=A0A7I7MLD4_9MYCO|nr:hypothetical protein MSHI_05760 [Mycobacterium shinjukuense]
MSDGDGTRSAWSCRLRSWWAATTAEIDTVARAPTRIRASATACASVGMDVNNIFTELLARLKSVGLSGDPEFIASTCRFA